MFLVLGWVAVAGAQESEFSPEGSNCADPWPIAGTAGVRNAGEAIQANANTYSAAAFANRHLTSVDEDSFWEIGDGGWVMGVYTDLNVTYGASQLVVHHPKALEYPQDCEAKWRTASKPLDLQAANVGLVFKKGPVGLFYATSFTWAAPAYGDQFTRLLMTSFVAPAYVLSASVLSGPLDLITRGPLESTNEFSSTRLEWMGGATVELDRVHVSAAYLSSKGAYVQASEEVVGSYVFAAIRPETGTVFEGGLDRLDPASLGNGSGKAGLLSLAYQDVPFFLMGLTQQAQRESASGAVQDAVERLRVGRINQQNIGEVFDLDDADFRFSLYVNDPDQLQLYPFARNAVSYQLMVSSAY